MLTKWIYIWTSRTFGYLVRNPNSACRQLKFLSRTLVNRNRKPHRLWYESNVLVGSSVSWRRVCVASERVLWRRPLLLLMKAHIGCCSFRPRCNVLAGSMSSVTDDPVTGCERKSWGCGPRERRGSGKSHSSGDRAAVPKYTKNYTQNSLLIQTVLLQFTVKLEYHLIPIYYYSGKWKNNPITDFSLKWCVTESIV